MMVNNVNEEDDDEGKEYKQKKKIKRMKYNDGKQYKREQDGFEWGSRLEIKVNRKEETKKRHCKQE